MKGFLSRLECVRPFLPAFTSDLANLLQAGPVGSQIRGQFCCGDERTALAPTMSLVDDRRLGASPVTLALLVGGK